ncbi:ribonuclease H [Alistipes sp. CAG:831]|nr:ribonuclease H [Alistipes sp. CAG:831]
MCAERKLPIEIFTDGSSRGNPGPGGYGVILRCGEHYKELSAGFPETTNNRMELTAVIVGLEAVKRHNAEIILYSDSKYVVDSVNKGWVFGWERKNFEKRLNADLWIRFLSVYRRHRVTFVWVKGHADNPMNNRCDQLAVAAATAVIKASGGKTPEPPPASAG